MPLATCFRSAVAVRRCGKTQANQRVILKFSVRLGHCVAFEILNLCDAGELTSEISLKF
ncbi:hypothetical protein [Campylobacter sp.]|uniref:hypothetical protein n=1 Tax=Campylobacter sp. TaxID=205 RepID=UPI0027B98828|nr:hypothetical protein [Campylobacter sp.]